MQWTTIVLGWAELISFALVSVSTYKVEICRPYLLAGSRVFRLLACATGSKACAFSKLRDVLKDDDVSRSSNSEVFVAVATEACRSCEVGNGVYWRCLERPRRAAQPTSRKDILKCYIK